MDLNLLHLYFPISKEIVKVIIFVVNFLESRYLTVAGAEAGVAATKVGRREGVQKGAAPQHLAVGTTAYAAVWGGIVVGR